MASGYQKLGTQEAMNDMYIVGGGTELTNWDGTQTAPTLTKNNANGAQRMPDKENFNCVIGGKMETVVRRLTPEECEALQGFPRGWTDLGDWVDSKGKKHRAADTPRYKALGNSIAVGFTNNQSGFWMWLMKRISAEYERAATLGSLFSGIGGFELAHVRYNGSDSVLWSSEIEEFPIAVLKKHFGDKDAGLKGDIQQYL